MSLFRECSRLSLLLFLLQLAAPAFGQGAAQVGRWDTPKPWPIIGIHSAVLPTGEVFNLTYVDRETELETAATVWNPGTGKFRNVSPGFGDMFCSGQNFMPNGELFVAGGYKGLAQGICPSRGINPTYIFNPFSLTWRSTGNMSFPRFYPTVIALGDGSQLIIGGQGENCQYIPIMEMYSPGRGLSRVGGPSQVMQDYPRVFLLSDGSLVQIAPELHTSIIDRSLKSWRNLAATRLLQDRFEAAGFYVPGKQDRLMVCGGYMGRDSTGFGPPTETCEMIDPLSANPSWRPVASLHQPRGDINVVLLPDGTVLAVGGGDHHKYEGPDLRPELYDPTRNTWTVMAPQRYGRMYHATAVLLPDGRVLSAGQDDDGHDGEVSGAWGEIFNPPYLFKGARPGITKAPTALAYGSSFEIDVSQTGSIAKLVLMGLSTVTHSTNVGQRYVPLEFSRKGGPTLTAQMTDNSNLAPPGYYMLFAVNSKGVPSKALMVQLAATCQALTLEHSPPAGGKDAAANPSKSAACAEAGTYSEGAIVNLTAQPAEGWEFARWTGTDNDTRKKGNNKVTMDADKTVSVEYQELGPACYKLTRTRKSKPGGDDPTAEPAKSTECEAEGQFLSGTEIALTAHPKSGWEVGRWIGTDHDEDVLDTNQLTMPASNHTVTVDYDKIVTSFDDSFESATFCNWTGRECKECDLSSCHVTSNVGALEPTTGSPTRAAKIANLLQRSDEAAMNGPHSLKLTYEAGSKSQDNLVDLSPARGGGEARYRASFWIRPQEGLVVKGTKTMIAQASQVYGASRPIFEVFLKGGKGQQKGTYAVNVQARTDSGARAKLAAAFFPAEEWHQIRVEWHAASAAGAGDGRIAVYLGDALVAERALNNASLRIDEMRFGQVKGKKRPTRGAVFFDLFESDWTP